MKRSLVIALAMLMAILSFQLRGVAPEAAAQSTATERAFVYGINAAIPGNYIGTFAPPAAGSIYLLAGETSVISPRMTEIYFWPITNEFRANWHTLNEPVSGVLEVSRNGAVVAELAPTDYTIHFTQDETTTTAEIFLGQEAIDAEAQFRARQDAFQAAAEEYNRAQREWLDAAARIGERQAAGESVELPPSPERPEPIGIFSNGLNKGIPIDLEPGQYALRLRGPDGTVIPGSERALTIFAARRSGVGYTVVPETRWTTPLESPSPNDVIVGAAESTIYLEPHLAREYPARDWALLQNPQRPAGDAGGWEWVNGERLTEGALEIVDGSQVVTERELTAFEVRQMPGSQLGYEVIELAANATGEAAPAPDFTAYPLQLAGAGEHLAIRLAAPEGGIDQGSERLVNVPIMPTLDRLLLLPAVPLVLGAMMITNRRRQARLPRATTA